MPAPSNKAAIGWVEYLRTPLPACSYAPTRGPEPADEILPGEKKDSKKNKVGSITDTQTTHPSSAASLLACDGPTSLKASHHLVGQKTQSTDRDVIVEGNYMQAGIDDFLNRAGTVIAEDPYTQPLYNEQGVAYVASTIFFRYSTLSCRELYFRAVLAPVQEALQTILKPLLERKDLAGPGYFFNIRQQQSSATGDRTRCDHYLVLEHLDGISSGQREVIAPQKQIVWSFPATFASRLKARVEWENGNKLTERPDYPRLVLCVIEEKKPNVIVEEEFRDGFKNRNTVGAKNVDKFLPQIKKYSVDAHCSMVLLTDYLHNMLLDIVVAGATFDEDQLKIVKVPDEVAIIHTDKLSHPPRYALFAAAIRRLVEADLIAICTKDDRKRNILKGDIDFKDN
ncbi:hypothetical protein DFH06DRAFT_1135632 [Mycena polygramma]|nr:hypothetical protein DFH06DRAFT_1135632 [Mycena polygramma]